MRRITKGHADVKPALLLLLLALSEATAIAEKQVAASSPQAAGRRLLQLAAQDAKLRKTGAQPAASISDINIDTVTLPGATSPGTSFSARTLPRLPGGVLPEVDIDVLRSAIIISGATCTVADVDVFVRLSKCGGPGIDADTGVCSDRALNTFPEEIDMRLTGPDGTQVALTKTFLDNIATWTKFDAGPIEGVRITLDSADGNPGIGSSDPSQPTAGTFQPEQSLDAFNGADANGAAGWTLEFADVSDEDPAALLEWGIDVTCEPPVVVPGEPACAAGTFIGAGDFFWGSPAPLDNNLAPSGGWPDACARELDVCQNELGQAAPGTLNTECGCALWRCLFPCFNPEEPSVSRCPVTGGAQPACPPFDLRAYYCSLLKRPLDGQTCPDAPAFPDDCASLAAPAPSTLAKRLQRHRA